MLSFVCLFFAVRAVFSGLLPAPRSLYVNHKPTHEAHGPIERKHLPIVEVFAADASVKLPIFSWQLYDDDAIGDDLYNISQKYYEIELYHEYYISNENNIIDRQLIWKSNQLESRHHFCNLGELNKLSAVNINFDQYKWKILSYCVRSALQHKDKPALITKWSNFGRFIVTSSSVADWNNASYIAQQTTSAFNVAAPMFTTTFSTAAGKTVSNAVISIIGLGFFRFYVNNNDVLNLQNPAIFQIGGWTNTEHRVPYATFDIAKYLQSNNELVVYTGEGYRNMSAFSPRGGARSKNDPIDCITRVQLIIQYSDNTQTIVISDNKWRTASTKIKLSSIYNGETYDENIVSSAQNAVTVIGPPGILFPTVQPYVSITKIVKPLDTIYRVASRNTQIVDFGVNNGAVVRINVGGLGLKKGDRISMKFAEVKQHPPYGTANGELYYGNLRTAQQYDTFVSGGNSSGRYTPFFTMHGFRYMEVWGYPRTLTVNDIEKLEVSANVGMRANWTSSDQTLNTVNDRCINGQLSNLKSVATDCNQRDERLGWMGDAALSADTFCINFNMQSFIANYLVLVTDAQDSNGAVPDVVPWYNHGGRPSDPNWGLAYPLDVNVLYQYYGSSFLDVVRQYMNGPTYNLPNYIKDLQSRMPKTNGRDDISKYPASYGDWVPPPPAKKISNNFAGAFGYIETVRIVKGLARIVGNTSYETYLNSLQSSLTTEFIAAFYNNGNGHYLTGLQSSYAMALHGELYSGNAMKSTLQTNLVKQIAADKNLLTTGIIGAKFILPVLHDMNQTALTLGLIKGAGLAQTCDENIPENGVAVLKCDGGGTITGITFASFGTPTGTCGNFKTSNCNSANSMSVVRGMCLNKNGCTIGVTNDVFGGDPCRNTVKHFDVEVTCSGAGNVSAATASYPSWAFEQENEEEPATAVWELWDAQTEGPSMNSRNHHMYGTVSAYLTTDVSGIKNVANQYNHWDVTIGHLLYDELKWSSFETDGGLVKFMWEWMDRQTLNMDIVIPFGHFGHLHFRLNRRCVISDGGKRGWTLNENGVIANMQSFIGEYDAKVAKDGAPMIGSGHYEWKIVCM